MQVEGSMQPPVTAPEVEPSMLNPDFWIEKIDGAGKPVLNREEVEKLNRQSYRRMKELGRREELYDLREYPGIISGEYLLEIMEEYSGREAFPDKPRYDKKGEVISESEKEEILRESNYDGIPDKISVKFGILVSRQNLRAFPTGRVFAPAPDKVDMDLFQLTALSANSPVAILHYSKSGEWAYVQSNIYRGWVRTNSIALVDNKEGLSGFLDTEKFLVVTGSRVETEPNPFDPVISNIGYQMGDRLPLALSGEIPDSIPEGNQHAQSAEGCYVIKVPTRDSRGRLKVKLALIARSNDLHEGYLPYTRENLIRQSFKMLGERYGWGGSFNRRDCSRFVYDIYRTVGVELPRDAGVQEKGAAGEFIEFSGDISAREGILAGLEAGDPLYLKGHVMIYLGRIGDNYYVIHDGSGYGVQDASGKVKPVTVHGVFVMELHQLLKGGNKTYLEALTTARRFK